MRFINKYKSFFWLVFASICSLSVAHAREIDMNFYGKLVEDACFVNINSVGQSVEFGSIYPRVLYKDGKSQIRKFQITLEDCDTQISQEVHMALSGSEDALRPGLLAVEGNAKGIVISLLQEDGTPIKINSDTLNFPLKTGITVINLAAQVVPLSPDIDIVEGTFSATAVFNLFYP